MDGTIAPSKSDNKALEESSILHVPLVIGIRSNRFVDNISSFISDLNFIL